MTSAANLVATIAGCALLSLAAVAGLKAQEGAGPEAREGAGVEVREGEWRTTSSLIKDDDASEEPFERYDYVNPDAPKGGTLNQIVTGTFDSFNPFIIRGTAAAGLNGFGGLLYDTLMQQSTAEPGTSHPLIAEAFRYPEDYSSATYRINPDARWHDGEPITSEDVVWSFKVLTENSQLYNRYFHNVTEVTALNEHEVRFEFDQTGNRELPHILGDLAVLPKHWWTGEDASGNPRDVTSPTLEPPLGSGPYRIESFQPGSEVVWSRVEDYWAADLPVNIGRYNFDRRRYTYFRDENAIWQAFTKGGLEDFRRENRAQRWAIGYDFPAFEAGDVKKEVFESTAGEPMQGYAINTRREKFKDPRVRQALTWAFDFQIMNRTLFYNSYTRTDSYFEGQELEATGLPTGLELEILETVREGVPEEVFTTELELPVYGSAENARENLRRAYELFRAAGWSNEGGRLVNEEGEQFTIEILGNSPSDERIATPYMDNLRRLGIDVTLRIVDTNQFINRYRSFEFDMTTVVLQQSASPGNEQRDFWSSAAADIEGSRNYSGIKSEAVDELINRIIYAEDREELVAATRALDRVLMWGFYVVPHWHLPEVWVAYWDKFGIPEDQPSYLGVDLESWWIRPDREEEIEERYEEAE